MGLQPGIPAMLWMKHKKNLTTYSVICQVFHIPAYNKTRPGNVFSC